MSWGMHWAWGGRVVGMRLANWVPVLKWLGSTGTLSVRFIEVLKKT